MIEFSVAGWSAWAPGLPTAEDWQAWATAPVLPQGDDTPALAEVPAMQRRRIERLGRMAIQVACWCEGEGGADSQVPLVFASRHGDVAKSMDLLAALTTDQPLSPTAFGLSVHNAIAALYSIARGHRGTSLALAGGRATVETACVEAVGLLAEGAEEVRLVVYDAPLPEVFREFADEPDPFFAWCWRLVAPVSSSSHGRPRFSLEWSAADADCPPRTGPLPHALDLHRFLLAGESTLQHVADGQHWRWTRHG